MAAAVTAINTTNTAFREVRIALEPTLNARGVATVFAPLAEVQPSPIIEHVVLHLSLLRDHLSRTITVIISALTAATVTTTTATTTITAVSSGAPLLLRVSALLSQHPIHLGVGVDETHVQLAHIAPGQRLLTRRAKVDDGFLLAQKRYLLLLLHSIYR